MLQNQFGTVEELSSAIITKLRLERCATVTLEKGKFKKKEGKAHQDYTGRVQKESQICKYLV